LHVRVEQEEEDDANGHEVHVDAEDDAAVIPTPSGLHTANRVCRPEGGDDGGKDQERGGAVVWESGEEKGSYETEQNQQAATEEGAAVEMEEVTAEDRMGALTA
jgi:hypothetical protein